MIAKTIPARASTPEKLPQTHKREKGSQLRLAGQDAIQGGKQALIRTVLVVGGEKVRRVTGWRATDFVVTMTHPTAECP